MVFARKKKFLTSLINTFGELIVEEENIEMESGFLFFIARSRNIEGMIRKGLSHRIFPGEFGNARKREERKRTHEKREKMRRAQARHLEKLQEEIPRDVIRSHPRLAPAYIYAERALYIRWSDKLSWRDETHASTTLRPSLSLFLSRFSA